MSGTTGSLPKVATIRDKLSQIRVCFSQAGLDLTWPQRAYKFLEFEAAARKKRGVEKQYVKPPFMPRHA